MRLKRYSKENQSPNDTITEFPQVNESRLPIKKRKLREIGLACNEPLPKTMISGFCPSPMLLPSHQVVTDPFKEKIPSSTTTSALEAIRHDIDKLMSSGVVDKADRKILLLETKNRWRTKLGLSEIQFSNGLWLLARNKANATFQNKENIVLTSPILVKSPRDLADPQSLVLADTTKSVVNSLSSPKNPDASGRGSVKVPEGLPIVERRNSWSNFLHVGIRNLGPYRMWG